MRHKSYLSVLEALIKKLRKKKFNKEHDKLMEKWKQINDKSTK